jgi:glycosyltransferase involved in cell wall biosynthesis
VILFPYAGETYGGSIHSSFLLVETLLRRGSRVLLAFHGDGPARDLAHRRGFPTIGLPPLGRASEMVRGDRLRAGHLIASPRCLRLLRRGDVDLVHVNDKRMLRTWMLPAKLAGRPLVAHWRSTYGPSVTIDLGLRIARSIVCVSHYSRDGLPPWARAKSEVVYNPFEPLLDPAAWQDARTRIRKAHGIDGNAAVVAYFGTLSKRKRPHVLLRILKAIERTRDGRPVVGVICGGAVEPRDEAFYRMLGEEVWGGRLVLPGVVDNVGEWMAAADVMVAPAVREPLARVGVEAQSMGLPAIVSSDGGLVEVVEHGVSGLVVDPEPIEAWVAAVRSVLDEPELRQKLRCGGRAAAAKLTLDAHTDHIDRVYREVLNGYG